MLLPVVLALPWLGLVAFLLFLVKLPRELPDAEGGRRDRPSVSVVVPARNEAVNIVACVESLCATEYPDFEVIVVDDRSSDGTGDLVRSLPKGRARALRVIDGGELPQGWLGKPWACAQGAAEAHGELILFTDADTVHGPRLLSKAWAGMEEDGADLVTLLGIQLMESFWERVVQPHIFMTMTFRYPDFGRIAERGHWRDAIANGQYMLFRRRAYDAIGGHEAVRGQVVEDQALAQLVKRSGLRLSVRGAEGDFATRMYRSLGELVRGWTKNIVHGGRASLPPALRAVMAPATLLASTVLWLVPPVCLVLALAGTGGAGLLTWAGVSVSASLAAWALFIHYMRGPVRYAFTYPLAAIVGQWIVLRASLQGAEVEWKGRRYTVESGLEEEG